MTQHRPHRHRKREPVLKPGDQLDGDLTVLEHIGGTRKVDIYLCRSRSIGEQVACKVLRPEFRIDINALQAVLHEGNMLLGLRHPNVVAGYKVELEPDPTVVMQLLGGQTLSTAIFEGNHKAFSVPDFVDIATQIADGLTYLHQQGILHLDVKTSNVMYLDGHATLFDLSVAKEFDPEKPFKDNAGTRNYMAPEQTRREYVGYHTDVYGLGVVFYRLLTNGELPYPVVDLPDPDNPDETLRQLDYSVDPVPPGSSNTAVPRELGDIALKAIAKSADDRYRTPAEFKAALQAQSKDTR